MFVIKNNFELSEDFFSEVRLYFKEGNQYKETDYSIASNKSSNFHKNKKLIKNKIFYVGESNKIYYKECMNI